MTAEEIAGLALFVSILAALHTYFASKQNRNLTRASIKSNLLSKMFELKLHDEEMIRKLEGLLKICKKKSPDFVDDINKWLQEQNDDYEFDQSNYETIKTSKYINSEELEELRHYIERALRRSEVLNANITDMIELIDSKEEQQKETK